MNDAEAYRSLFENVSDGVYTVDRDRTITSWNRGAALISGFTPDEVIGRQCRRGILNHVSESGLSLCGERCPLKETMENGETHEAHIWMNRADGTRLPVRVRATPLHDANGQIVGALEIFTDDTPVLNARAKVRDLERATTVDPLTGLGGPDYLRAHLDSFFETWQRHNWPFGILIIDINDLGLINDENGREVGDQALKIVAGTLTQALPYTAVTARDDNAHFIVLEPCADEKELHKIAERIRRMAMVSRLMVDQQRIPLTASIGGAMCTLATTPTALLHQAESALLAAKKTGPNTVVINQERARNLR